MQEMSAMEYVPSLTLEPDVESVPTAVAIPTVNALELGSNVAAEKLDISHLTEAEQKAVFDFANKIDITNTNAVLTYGASSQRNIANFSESTLKSVRTKDMGEVGSMLSSLVMELKGFSDAGEEKKGY